jgi:hypothetical protein
MAIYNPTDEYQFPLQDTGSINFGTDIEEYQLAKQGTKLGLPINTDRVFGIGQYGLREQIYHALVAPTGKSEYPLVGFNADSKKTPQFASLVYLGVTIYEGEVVIYTPVWATINITEPKSTLAYPLQLLVGSLRTNSDPMKAGKFLFGNDKIREFQRQITHNFINESLVQKIGYTKTGETREIDKGMYHFLIANYQQ